MKCSASPTTFNAPSAVHAPTPDDVETSAFVTILAGKMLEPLANAMGPVGDVVTSSVASSISTSYVRGRNVP